MEPKFKSHKAYLEWCSEIVQTLYSACIAMNGERIQAVLKAIGDKLHLSEGQELFP